MQAKIEIRTAVITDASVITFLSDQLGYASVESEIHDRLVPVLLSMNDCFFVAISDGHIVGWIHGFYALRVESDSFVELGGMVVDEKFRNRGIGKLLVEKVYEWALSKNCKRIRVRSNIIRNDAHAFYLSLGFIEIKQQKVFGRDL